jgi:GAF domain-containing protein
VSSSKKVLGVITLYVREGHRRKQSEEEFLTASANTFAGTIELKQTEQALKVRENELEIKARILEEANTALKVLLKQSAEDKTELEENVLSNMKELVALYLEKLMKSGLGES